MTERTIKLARKALMDPDIVRALGAVRTLRQTHFYGSDEAHFGRYELSIYCLSSAEETAGMAVVGAHAKLFWIPAYKPKRRRLHKVRLMLFRHAGHYSVGDNPVYSTRHLSALDAADDFCKRIESVISPVRIGYASLVTSGMGPPTALPSVKRYFPGDTDD